MLLAVAALFLAGCDVSSTATDDSNDTLKKTSNQKNVTFYVAEMNEKLGIY